MWDIDENVNQLVEIEGNLLLVYLPIKRQLSILTLSVNFDYFRAMKQRRGVSTMLFKIDNSKCLFLENAETVNFANVYSPYDASIIKV